jgi:hypothetical protein
MIMQRTIRATFQFPMLCLCAAAVAFAPVSSRADGTNAPAPSKPAAPAKPKKKATAFSGQLTAVDTNAMTLTVTNLTLFITSTTTMKIGSAPAIVKDMATNIGITTSGTYKLSDDGRIEAVTVNLKPKPAPKKKKEKETAPATPPPAAPAPTNSAVPPAMK